MKSKVIVITGASGGIGAAAARRLAYAGHHVVVVGRLATKTAAVGQELNTEHFVADFTRLSDVQALAKRLLETYPRIDVLAHNAGDFFSRERRITVDGHEVTFQVNYLAGFLLTKLLLDRLIESRATVICTSSMTNRFGNIDLDDLESERHYSATKAYCNSKLAQIMFTRELYRRYGRRGLDAAAFHPGNVASRLLYHAGSVLRWLGRGPIEGPLARQSGARRGHARVPRGRAAGGRFPVRPVLRRMQGGEAEQASVRGDARLRPLEPVRSHDRERRSGGPCRGSCTSNQQQRHCGAVSATAFATDRMKPVLDPILRRTSDTCADAGEAVGESSSGCRRASMDQRHSN